MLFSSVCVYYHRARLQAACPCCRACCCPTSAHLHYESVVEDRFEERNTLPPMVFSSPGTPATAAPVVNLVLPSIVELSAPENHGRHESESGRLLVQSGSGTHSMRSNALFDA